MILGKSFAPELAYVLILALRGINPLQRGGHPGGGAGRFGRFGPERARSEHGRRDSARRRPRNACALSDHRLDLLGGRRPRPSEWYESRDPHAGVSDLVAPTAAPSRRRHTGN